MRGVSAPDSPKISSMVRILSDKKNYHILYDYSILKLE